MKFKYEAAECRRLVVEALHAPYAWVERRVVRLEISDHMHAWLMWDARRREVRCRPWLPMRLPNTIWMTIPRTQSSF